MIPHHPTRHADVLLPILLALGLTAAPVRADRTTSYTYTVQGQIATVDGPRTDVNDITTYDYDDQGNRILVRNALDHETYFTAHDGAGRALNIVDPNGLTTQLAYDLRGRLTTQSVSDAATTRTTTYTYDPVGNLIQVEAPDGSILKYDYDATNHLTGLEDGEGNRIDYTLDAMGNQLESHISDASGTLRYSHWQVYNRLGRLVQSIDAQEHTTDYAYDASGNLTQITDARQNPTQQAYDAFGRLTQTIDALDGMTRYTYDAQDNLTSVTDPNDLTTNYEYEGLGNLISQTSPDTGITTYTHDEAGNRLTQTDARGITLSYEYDALNRLIAVHYPDSILDVTYSYDAGDNGIGRLTAMSDAEGTTTYSYNVFGDLTAKTRTTVDGVVTTFIYAYDNTGRLSAMTYPSGRTLQYGYDTYGELNSLTMSYPDGTSQVLAQNIQQMPFGSLESFVYGNGLSLSQSYDLDYRLIAQTIPGILQSGFQYDPVGNIIQWLNLLDTGRDQFFSYDQLDRLTIATGAYGEFTYDYDAVGNRLSLTDGSSTEGYSYVPGSHHLQQILGDTADIRSYDEAGNTLLSLIGSYTYDVTNRMVGFSTTGIEAEYAYNGRGERIKKTLNGTVTRFRYGENAQLLGEYDESGQAMREYVYLHGQPVSMLPGETSNPAPVILQRVSVNHNAISVSLGHHTTQPIVVTSPPTMNGSHGAVIALSDINADMARVRIKEWNYLDGEHVYEELSLLALPSGRYIQSDGSVWEVGSFTITGTQNWQPVSFQTSFDAPPHLFLTQQTLNEEDTAVVRAKSVDASGFEAALYEQGSLQNGHIEERIGYLAIYSPTEGGSVLLQGQTLTYQLERVDLNHTWLSVGDQQVMYQEEQSNDSETEHLYEQVDILHLDGHLFAQDITTLGGDTAVIRRQGTTPETTIVGELSGDGSGDEVFYLHTDHLGVVVRATDSARSVVWDMERRPFGLRTPITQQIEVPLGFPGQYFDQESGNFYNYFRDYDPSTGRYLQSDPIGLDGGLNTYTYAEGNPTNHIDPEGLRVKPQDILAVCLRWPSMCVPPILIPDPPYMDGPGTQVTPGGVPIVPMNNDVAHPEEEEVLDATCEDASWAIPKLKELIESRKRQYKASGGGRIDINPTGPGHKKRIKKLEDKLKWLENCPKNCP
ncbi:RHS repeat-associated core domain-containing protein [Sedimenticola sp.]|uniref:RHS repeat-associated core domain-containing protein n=1 Tax=Sedimenticola sp. TaxID=1940285 RepID=UPI003D0D8594